MPRITVPGSFLYIIDDFGDGERLIKDFQNEVKRRTEGRRRIKLGFTEALTYTGRESNKNSHLYLVAYCNTLETDEKHIHSVFRSKFELFDGESSTETYVAVPEIYQWVYDLSKCRFGKICGITDQTNEPDSNHNLPSLPANTLLPGSRYLSKGRTPGYLIERDYKPELDPTDGESDWVTPDRYLRAIKDVLASKDFPTIDVCTDPKTGRNQGYDYYYTRNINALEIPWLVNEKPVNAYCFPPGQGKATDFLAKALSEFIKGHVKELIFTTDYNRFGGQEFGSLLDKVPYDFYIKPRQRVEFIRNITGKQGEKGSRYMYVFLYFGYKTRTEFGNIWYRYFPKDTLCVDIPMSEYKPKRSRLYPD